MTWLGFGLWLVTFCFWMRSIRRNKRLMEGLANALEDQRRLRVRLENLAKIMRKKQREAAQDEETANLRRNVLSQLALELGLY